MNTNFPILTRELKSGGGAPSYLYVRMWDPIKHHVFYRSRNSALSAGGARENFSREILQRINLENEEISFLGRKYILKSAISEKSHGQFYVLMKHSILDKTVKFDKIKNPVSVSALSEWYKYSLGNVEDSEVVQRYCGALHGHNLLFLCYVLYEKK